MKLKPLLILLILLCLSRTVLAQDSPSKPDNVILPSSFLNKVSNNTAALETRLTRQTEKYLKRLAKKEAKLKRKLSAIDSSAAKNWFADDPQQQYQRLIEKLKSDTGVVSGSFRGEYLP